MGSLDKAKYILPEDLTLLDGGTGALETSIIA